jgi:hypothetical protein
MCPRQTSFYESTEAFGEGTRDRENNKHIYIHSFDYLGIFISVDRVVQGDVCPRPEGGRSVVHQIDVT